MRSLRPALATVLLALLALLLSACGATTQPAQSSSAPSSGPVVVVSTSWAGAFATAAGARNVTLVAPVSVPHVPDYDPKPSDLATIGTADYLLYAPFDSFAPG